MGGTVRSDDDVPERTPLERLIQFLENQVQGRLFGKVIVTFQDGRVCEVRLEQIKKLSEL
jgi:hypothetical protein